MAAANLSSIPVICDGDTIYFRRLGKSTMEQAKVLEVAPAQPVPLLFLSTGEILPAFDGIVVITKPEKQP